MLPNARQLRSARSSKRRQVRFQVPHSCQLSLKRGIAALALHKVPTDAKALRRRQLSAQISVQLTADVSTSHGFIVVCAQKLSP
jgi:hypothetical protein